MAAAEIISGKLRKPARDIASDQARELGSNQLEVTHTALMNFMKQPLHRRKAAIEELRKLFPMHVPRVGRGNRKVPA